MEVVIGFLKTRNLPAAYGGVKYTESVEESKKRKKSDRRVMNDCVKKINNFLNAKYEYI